MPALSSSGRPTGTFVSPRQTGRVASLLADWGGPALALSLQHQAERTCAARSFGPVTPPVLGVTLSQLHSSLLSSLFFFLSQYKGIFESYLTDSIKLTPDDKPKARCC